MFAPASRGRTRVHQPPDIFCDFLHCYYEDVYGTRPVTRELQDGLTWYYCGFDKPPSRDTIDRFLTDLEHVIDDIFDRLVEQAALGDGKLVTAEKETDEDEENPVKYLATNKIDAPTEHVIRSYGMRWRIETFFEDSKQDLGLGDCEMQTDEVASRHWHLLMAAYSLVRLDPEPSTLGTVRSKASSLRANLEHFLKETVYNLFPWVRDNDDRDVDDLMNEIDHLFVHSIGDANLQS